MCFKEKIEAISQILFIDFRDPNASSKRSSGHQVLQWERYDPKYKKYLLIGKSTTRHFKAELFYSPSPLRKVGLGREKIKIFATLARFIW